MPAGSIAKRLGTPRKVIDAAVTANASEVAKTAANTHTLTLTDAALIAEFENDENVVKDILTAVKDGRSTEHVAQRARDARERQRAHDEAVAALTEAGVRVIDRPDYTNKTINRTAGHPPSHQGRHRQEQGPHRGRARDLPRPRRLRHRRRLERHPTRPDHVRVHQPDRATGTPCTPTAAPGRPAKAPGGPMSEAQKAERRTLIANNKAWDAAEKVRRAWITDAFLTRTSPPKNAEAFVARAVVHGEHTQDDNRLYTTLTNGQDDDGYDFQATQRLITRAETAPPRQAVMLALALLVCEWESGTSRNTWRHPSERDRRYLGALIQWGYQPADVEQLILTDLTATPDTARTGPVGADLDSQAARTGQFDDLHGRRPRRRAGRQRRGQVPTLRATTRPTRTEQMTMCEQCGSRARPPRPSTGALCESCAFRQVMHDERRARFEHLSPSTFGFDPPTTTPTTTEQEDRHDRYHPRADPPLPGRPSPRTCRGGGLCRRAAGPVCTGCGFPPRAGSSRCGTRPSSASTAWPCRPSSSTTTSR